MATVRATITGNGAARRGIIVQFHGWGDGSGNGWLPDLMPVVDRFRRNGQAGSGRQHLGTESPGKSVPVVVWCASETAMIRTLDDLEDLAGYPVQLTDPWSRTLTIQIDGLDLTPRRCKGPILSAGVPAIYRVGGTLSVERLT